VSARFGTGLFGINNSLNGSSLGAVPSFGGLSYLKQLELIQPALLIISHGINERKASTAPATFQANLDAWVAAAIQFTSVLIVTQNPDGQEYANPASLYNQACYDVAKKYGTAFINMHSLFGGTYAKAVTNGYMGVEQTHPNATGHTFYYNTIYNALTVT
jgi:lysophospholipase L1-like esterase